MSADRTQVRIVITSIDPVPDRPDRVRVELSDGAWFEVEQSHPDRGGLEPGVDATSPVVASLLADHLRRDIRGKALDLLSRRDHLSVEIRRRLEDQPQDLLDEEIEALCTDGWLDDSAVARRRVDRWRAEGRSDRECRQRLEACGLGSATIDRAIASEDETHPAADPDVTALIRLIERQNLHIAGLPPVDVRRHAARWARRGFELDTIRAVLRECGGTDSALDDSSLEIPMEDDS